MTFFEIEEMVIASAVHRKLGRPEQSATHRLSTSHRLSALSQPSSSLKPEIANTWGTNP